MIDSNVTTIILDGNEIKVEFGSDHPYYQITNKGDTDIYASMSPNITPETDGVYTVSAGGSEIIGDGYPFGAFYLLGTGKVYIRGKRDAMSASFKPAAKGGDSGDGLKPKIVTELPEIGDSKYLYLVPKDDLLSDNIYDEYVWVDEKWELIGNTVIEVNLENYVQNPDNLNIMVAKNSTNGLSSSTFTFADHIQINTIFPLLNKLPNGENRQVVEMSIPSASQSKAGVMTAADKTKMDNLPLDLSDYATIEQLNTKLTKKYSPIYTAANKTLGELKTAILSWYQESFFSYDRFIFGGGSISALTDNWNDDEYIIPLGNVNTLIPVATGGSGTNDFKYGAFILASYFENRFCLVNLTNGILQKPRFIYHGEFTPPNDDKQDVLTQPAISNPDVDWNTITETGFYTIGYSGGITADSHGPLGVTSWGLLTVINTGLGSSNPACVKQIYEAGSAGLYTRNKWQIDGEWDPWCVYHCETYAPAQNKEV